MTVRVCAEFAIDHQSPNRWEKGTTPVPILWEAGLQYDGDLKRADDVLADFGTYYPGATNDDYEIAGFFWWQVRLCECVHVHQSATGSQQHGALR